MPFQNRVTPMGEIVADPARGTFFGNRGGRIHGPGQRLTKRRWASRAWICCVLEFKNRQRQIMSPNSYTELFFLDEVTALAAGHRPCFECRRRDALSFLNAYAEASGLDCRPSAPEFDRVAHDHRLNEKAKRVIELPADGLPDGTMVAWQQAVWAVYGQNLLRWSFGGYTECQRRPSEKAHQVITPYPMVEALRLGYNPVFHLSADRIVRA
ncbi:MAG: hypothetical protein GY948_25955 [Alphaproteobacteria bacterium]|nr:hypothetical protein [Alphaproteobacteria bacterium]